MCLHFLLAVSYHFNWCLSPPSLCERAWSLQNLEGTWLENQFSFSSENWFQLVRFYCWIKLRITIIEFNWISRIEYIHVTLIENILYSVYSCHPNKNINTYIRDNFVKNLVTCIIHLKEVRRRKISWQKKSGHFVQTLVTYTTQKDDK